MVSLSSGDPEEWEKWRQLFWHGTWGHYCWSASWRKGNSDCNQDYKIYANLVFCRVIDESAVGGGMPLVIFMQNVKWGLLSIKCAYNCSLIFVICNGFTKWKKKYLSGKVCLMLRDMLANIIYRIAIKYPWKDVHKNMFIYIYEVRFFGKKSPFHTNLTEQKLETKKTFLRQRKLAYVFISIWKCNRTSTCCQKIVCKYQIE